MGGGLLRRERPELPGGGCEQVCGASTGASKAPQQWRTIDYGSYRPRKSSGPGRSRSSAPVRCRAAEGYLEFPLLVFSTFQERSEKDMGMEGCVYQFRERSTVEMITCLLRIQTSMHPDK